MGVAVGEGKAVLDGVGSAVAASDGVARGESGVGAGGAMADAGLEITIGNFVVFITVLVAGLLGGGFRIDLTIGVGVSTPPADTPGKKTRSPGVTDANLAYAICVTISSWTRVALKSGVNVASGADVAVGVGVGPSKRNLCCANQKRLPMPKSKTSPTNRLMVKTTEDRLRGGGCKPG